jgi:antitoxin component YwqK of YwqJK toxin-antitoxin module
MTPAGSGGVGSSTEPPKSKGVEKADTPKEPKKDYGCVEGDCVNGKGKFIFSIPEAKKPFYYEGSFNNGHPTGGKYTFPDGSYQIGMFTNEGMVGKEFYPNGNLKFVGNFKSTRTPVVDYVYLPTQGEKYYPNGKLEFRGRYKKKGYKQNDLLTITTDLFLYFVEMDQGTYFYNDGSYYQGHYKNNLPNGQGIKYGANDKIIFSGEWVNGEPKKK